MTKIDNFQAKDQEELLAYVETINPILYERSRNSLAGSVTHLSPYITCGAISLNQVKDTVRKKYKSAESLKLIQELAWRDFFQSVYASLGRDIFVSIKREQGFGVFDELPKVIIEANTGIKIIDNAIKKLYQTGYLHNHERMWIAMLVCNIAGIKWQAGAKWMYYHLIDGDLASNTLSWQWVAGTFSAKKYFANQENLNKYGLSQDRQKDTFLDKSYEELDADSEAKIFPGILQPRMDSGLIDNTDYLASFFEQVSSPVGTLFTITTITDSLKQKNDPVLVYCHDSDWLISRNRIDFVVNQINKIAPNTKLFLVPQNHPNLAQILKLLPTQERMFPSLTDYYPSFFKFWSKAERLI